MTKALEIDPQDAVPIWRQIEDGVRRMVATGGLSAGSPVPSVRDLAKDLRVNPATVAKAYQRLTEAGLLTVRRGDGTYVSDAPPVMPKGERTRQLRDAASRYAGTALSTGATEEDAHEELDGAFRALAPKGGRR
jgi:GntR family transcriptional regulator